ncbi:MAG: hypothetical protein IKB53_00900 [Oscillospiraceae bacterium]|nr:hypothetical protein [Oscillospiraceae bacterium]
MKEFFMAALPWVCMGVAVAVAMKLLQREKEAAKNGTEEEKAAAQQRSRNMVNGICTGEAIGLCIATGMDLPIGVGIAGGMLLGVLLGARKR